MKKEKPLTRLEKLVNYIKHILPINNEKEQERLKKEFLKQQDKINNLLTR